MLTKNSNWVFAVHSYETGDSKHHVSYKNGGKTITKGFATWGAANRFANLQAKKQGLSEYQIDTPNRPHKMVKTKNQKRPSKTHHRKKKQNTRVRV